MRLSPMISVQLNCTGSNPTSLSQPSSYGHAPCSIHSKRPHTQSYPSFVLLPTAQTCIDIQVKNRVGSQWLLNCYWSNDFYRNASDYTILLLWTVFGQLTKHKGSTVLLGKVLLMDTSAKIGPQSPVSLVGVSCLGNSTTELRLAPKVYWRVPAVWV